MASGTFQNETANGWILCLTHRSALWTAPGDTASRSQVRRKISATALKAMRFSSAGYHFSSDVTSPGYQCDACHDWTPDYCSECHEQRPASHAGNWKKDHGPHAKARGTSCLVCHDKKKFCGACH